MFVLIDSLSLCNTCRLIFSERFEIYCYFYIGHGIYVSSICGALRDLVPFAQFKKREKRPWRSVTFSKVAGFNFTKINTPP